MRKTYAYNSIIFGVLLGILVYASTESVVLCILTGLAVSVVGFFIIRLIENAINKGVDKAADKISDAYQRRKQQKAIENGTYRKPAPTTQMPQRTAATQMPQRTAAQPAAQTSVRTEAPKATSPVAQPFRMQMPVKTAVQTAAAFASGQGTAAVTNFCPFCGRKVNSVSRYCPYCGKSID